MGLELLEVGRQCLSPYLLIPLQSALCWMRSSDPSSPLQQFCKVRTLQYIESRSILFVMLWLCYLNKAKCNVLHLGQGNPIYKYRLEEEFIETRPMEEDLEVLTKSWT